MAVAGINSYNKSSLSYKIVLDSKDTNNAPYEERIESWVQENPVFSLLATALFFGSARYVAMVHSFFKCRMYLHVGLVGDIVSILGLFERRRDM